MEQGGGELVIKFLLKLFHTGTVAPLRASLLRKSDEGSFFGIGISHSDEFWNRNLTF